MKSRVLLLIMLVAAQYSFAQLAPSNEYAVSPADFGMNYQDVEIATQDGMKLKGWFFKPTNPSKRVIIISDDGTGNMADNIEIISNFLSIGYHVLAYDYRGFGESSEFEINPKFYIRSEFTKDMISAINWCKKYQAKLTAVDLYGIGMGAGLSIAVGCNNTNIRYVIADAPYYSLEHMRKKMSDVEGTELMMPMGYNKIEMEPKYSLVEKGKHLDGILIIYGETDLVIGPEEFKMFSKGSVTKVSSFEVEGVVNEETFTNGKDVYFDHIKKFLKL